MANNTAFSPKQWTVLIRPQIEWGETEAGTDMYQLDVDSVSMPSLGVNQSLDVRSSSGRTFTDEDFFHDNKMRAVEMTFSGNFHTDAAHKYPFLNLANIATSNDNVTINLFCWWSRSSLSRVVNFSCTNCFLCKHYKCYNGWYKCNLI